MIEKLLKAKHWQLFLVIYAIPMILQFGLMGLIFMQFANESDPDIEAIFAILQILPLFFIPLIFIFFGWFWSVGVGLNRMLPAELRQKTGKFKAFLIVPIVYITLVTVFMMVMIKGIMMLVSINLTPIIVVVLPLHLFSMFCIFYCIYFVAKTIKTAELQKEVEPGDFVGEFFLIWFFPIGVWFLQPKINTMMREIEDQFL